MRRTIIIRKEQAKDLKAIKKYINNGSTPLCRHFSSQNIVEVKEYSNTWHVIVDDSIINFE